MLYTLLLQHNVPSVEKEINWSPGLCKIVDELIVNSYDQSLRDETLENISVDINPNSFTIFNDGIGIDVVKHPTHQIYIPELIFFVFLIIVSKFSILKYLP